MTSIYDPLYTNPRTYEYFFFRILNFNLRTNPRTYERNPAPKNDGRGVGVSEPLSRKIPKALELVAKNIPVDTC